MAPETGSRRGAARVALAVLAAPSLVDGAWALLAPHSFYQRFPGLGRVWIAPDGPYNEHLIRDFGALNLALVALTVCAIVSLTVPLVRATAIAWLVFGIPHLIYHASHTAAFDLGDNVAIIGGLALVPLLAVVAWVLAGRSSPS
jgi:hypothetical protein